MATPTFPDVPVHTRKPGALRNGAPFKDWVLPAAMERVRRKLASVDDGNRQMVDILAAVLTDGLPAVRMARSTPRNCKRARLPQGYVELVAQEQVLGLKPSARLEQVANEDRECSQQRNHRR